MKKSPRSTLAVAALTFIALGIVTAAFGPALPELAVQTGSSIEAVGAIFTTLFLGALTAQAVSGFLIDRWGARTVLLVSSVILAAGTLGVAFSTSLTLYLVCGVLMGIGHGAVDVATNVLIAAVYEKRSLTVLNLLHFFFGTGAVMGPLAASFLLRQFGTALPALWAGSAVLVLAVPLVFFLALSPRSAPAVRGEVTPAAPILRSNWLWLTALLLMIYVGTETGLGNWTPVYMLRTTPFNDASAALTASGFWLALTAGRLAGTFLGKRLQPRDLLRLSVLGGLAGGILLAASSGSAVLTIAGVLLAGFSFGPIFPTTVALVTSRIPRAAGKATSLVTAFGSIGGMLLPALQGVLIERVSPLAGILLSTVGTVLMVGLFYARREPKPAAPAPAPVVESEPRYFRVL